MLDGCQRELLTSLSFAGLGTSSLGPRRVISINSLTLLLGRTLWKTHPLGLSPSWPHALWSQDLFLLCRGRRRRWSRRSPSHKLPSTLSCRGGTEEELIFPPPYQPHRVFGEHSHSSPGEADAAPREEGGGVSVGSPPYTRQRAQREQSASIMVPQMKEPISPITTGLSPLVTSIINWKAQNPKFSEKLAMLIDLLDYVLFNHQPIWDDC